MPQALSQQADELTEVEDWDGRCWRVGQCVRRSPIVANRNPGATGIIVSHVTCSISRVLWDGDRTARAEAHAYLRAGH